MPEITFNPFAMIGVNVNGDSADPAAEGGLTVSKHVKRGNFEADFSGIVSGSMTGVEKRVTGSVTISGMLKWPFYKTVGPRVSYNIDEENLEVGLVGCAQTLIPVTGNYGVFAGGCFVVNDLLHLQDDGFNGMATLTGQF